MVEGTRRPTFAEVDLDAVAHNSAVMAGVVAPARLCAVVKADAYGHGAPACAAAALEGGASELAVALVEEGVELREAGIAAPVLVLSEPGPDAMAEAFVHGLTPTLYTASGVAAARRAARSQAAPGRTSPGPTAPGRTPGRWRVEVKLDTGMHRVGASPHELARLVSAVVASDELSFAGLWTHLAVADEPDDPFTKVQLDTLAAARRGLLDAGLPAPGRVHAANSAGGIAWPESRLDLVRCGISIYGYAPSASVAPLLAGHRLWPALSFKSRVGFVRRLPAGERLSYGLARELPGECFVATVPAGYADGIPRAYFDKGGEVLVNGRRRLLAGAVTMDQIMLDCGGQVCPKVGDEVVLIGLQGGEEITAEKWASRLGTISYEVLARIGPRVPRLHLRGGTRPSTPVSGL